MEMAFGESKPPAAMQPNSESVIQVISFCPPPTPGLPGSKSHWPMQYVKSKQEHHRGGGLRRVSGPLDIPWLAFVILGLFLENWDA